MKFLAVYELVVEGDLTDFDEQTDRKSTRLNSSHLVISYAVFSLKKKHSRRSSRRRETPGSYPPISLRPLPIIITPNSNPAPRLARYHSSIPSGKTTPIQYERHIPRL